MINLLVIRSLKPKLLSKQYEQLGLSFHQHKHGQGPVHFAAEQNGFVFEIYPLSPKKKLDSSQLRIGFEVSDLNSLIKDLEKSNWKIVQMPTESEWGFRAVLKDMDGRKVELTQK